MRRDEMNPWKNLARTLMGLRPDEMKITADQIIAI